MNLKSISQNFSLLLVAIIIALALSELIVRVVKPVYDYGDQILLFSSPTFKLYSGGSIRYRQHDRIREVPVFLDKIEYDVIYNTNNSGFVDTKDYRYESVPGKNYYAFVGDSFTVGAGGGGTWVPNLRKKKANAEIYNFGVAGTGFEHFYRLLHDMKNELKFTHIILVAITDDFYRSYWHPLVQDDKIRFCYEDGPHEQCQSLPIAAIIPINASKEAILKLAQSKFREKKAEIDQIKAAKNLRSKLEAAIYDESALFYYGKVLLDTYNKSNNPSDIADAIASISKIRNEFPDIEIHMIHLPQKYEVITKHYSVNIADQVSALGIKYYPALEKCNWTTEMFFERDAHPNKLGYENITQCVAEYLF